jgi:NhaP-type Na+/H+ or K+/H+ antiporter
MTEAAAFILLGALFLVGLAADELGHRTRLPRVTLMLALGLLAGRAGFGWIPEEAHGWFSFLSTTALTMVAFLLGGSMTVANLRSHGREILWISVIIVVVTFFLVATGLWLLGIPLPLALLLGAIACATAPAGTQDAIRQTGIESAFAEKLKGIVAIDDAWGLIVFSLAIVAAQSLTGHVDFDLAGDVVWEIGGSVVLGVVIGLPGAVLTGRISPGEPLQAEALGLVFLTAGLSLWLELSFLIAAMVAGAVIVNRARHHTRAFHEIERIQWPFMILFFVLAGASLEVEQIAQIGVLGAGYLGLRIVARIVGGWAGARLGGSAVHERAWFGPALLSQAGVAVGMALVASQEFPEYAEVILSLTIGATVVFELLGPVGVVVALRRVEAASKSGEGTL